MEPFVQRMLERAKVRREKLDTQLSNAGHDIIKRRSPLKDANALLSQAAVTNKSTVTSSTKTMESTSPIKISQKSPVPTNILSTNNEQGNKENGPSGSHDMRCKLHRLGKLYSDDDNNLLSSPIHKTEEKFSAEDHTERKQAKRGARLDRLAALASTINNWEDDLSHPTLIKSSANKVEQIQKKSNEQIKNAKSSPQPSTSGANKWALNNNERRSKDGNSVKHLKWDKTVLDKLEAQGFSRTESNSRLVYDYKDCSQQPKVVMSHTLSNKLITQQHTEGTKEISSHKSDMSPRSKPIGNTNTPRSPVTLSESNNKNFKSPEKIVKNTNSTSSSRLPSRFGYHGSPKDSVQTAGSVLSKASMFEAKNTDTKTKDPAQMTLAERMALFERNKGEAPLIPKAPLTMSVPFKKLQEKEKCGIQSGSNLGSSSTNNRKIDIPKKIVSSQRTGFTGQNIEEMENKILQATQVERQRELDMLRSRFNGNKEAVRTAAGSCIRTSESSEGKPSSPKNSPVCPVKPTPAPDNVPPPPPPPPPQHPQIISYHCKPSIKRQVAASPPKVQYSNIADIKRIRVCSPKLGESIYPNLSEIGIESENDTEYTVDSTEAETATFEKTDTETDSHIPDYETYTESDQENIQANTSFGRSILHAFNERSAFNQKRSIDPDPDSSTSDISVLDEMDHYLDECLAMEEYNADAREEGPTPPKINKGGKSPSTASNSIKFRSPLKTVSSPKKINPYIEDGGTRVPLMRTVSAYRRQQSELAKTPTRTVARRERSSSENRENEAIMVETKIKKLLDEVCTHQKKIEEASKALNLCFSTIEFNGSSEHVGGEWALLVAINKRQAAINEIQRLKREGTLRPIKAGSSEVRGNGSITISAITVPLKPEYFRRTDFNSYLHCICLMRHLGEVVATQAATAEPGDTCLRFTSTLKFDNLYSDFNISVEVYYLQTQPKYLPHERKYHINHSGINKKAANKTPKRKNQFIIPNINSPAGPTAVRSSGFELSGTTTIELSDVNREQFTLYGLSVQSPLEGFLRMHVSRQITVSIEHRGFLTVFEEISGFGAWDRRWCLLKDAKLLYWLHPKDEHKKPPLNSLDLQDITTKNIEFVNKEKCARPFTFLLETVRPAQPEDVNNLVMKTNGIETKIENFLLADTREEGLLWLSKLNQTLSIIRTWSILQFN